MSDTCFCVAGFSAEEARALLNSIEIDTLIGLRDRALIGLMVYTFARVGAALKMRVEDYFVQGRRGWARLHEKGGQLHSLPCHHNLEAYLEQYIEAAGIAGAGAGCRHPDGNLQSHVPRHRHHCLAQERRPAGNRAADGQPGLYDRRDDDITLDEVERVAI